MRGWALPGLGSRVMEGPEPEPGLGQCPEDLGAESRDPRETGGGENCGRNDKFNLSVLFSFHSFHVVRNKHLRVTKSFK